MKKVLHIPNYYYPHIGGIEQVTRDCVNALKGKYEQRIICFNSDKNTIKETVDDVPITRVGKNVEVLSQSICLSYKKELRDIIDNFNPDIIVFHYPNPYVAHYLIPLIKKRNIKFILYWHLDITKQKIVRGLFVHQNNKLLDMADVVVATSPNYVEGSKYLSKHKNKCIVINNCINDSRLALNDDIVNKSFEIKKSCENKKILFAIGRHVKYKGIGYLVEAAKYLPQDVVVYIGGKGPLTENLQKQARGLKNIKFLGRLSDEDFKAYLLACDVFCFPSITKNEAFGLALAEAMYYGKPSVTFTIPGSGVNYVSLDNVTGLETHFLDAKLYAENIIKMLNNPVMCSEMGNKAKERVLELFTYSRYKNSICDLFNKISNN